MMLAAAPTAAVRYAVMVCTAVTTICGIWLAYGEPPNLIMKANLHPVSRTTPSFSATARRPPSPAIWSSRGTCAASSAGSASISRTMDRPRRQRRGRAVPAGHAPRRGADAGRAGRGARGRAGRPGASAVLDRLRSGESLGLALVREDVAVEPRRMLLGHFVSDDLADGLDRHYVLEAAGRLRGGVQRPNRPSTKCSRPWRRCASARRGSARWRSCRSSRCSIVHGIDHDVPLFLASFAGFLAALPAIWRIPKMRAPRAARGPARVRRVLLPVSAVPVDYAA